MSSERERWHDLVVFSHLYEVLEAPLQNYEEVISVVLGFCNNLCTIVVGSIKRFFFCQDNELCDSQRGGGMGYHVVQSDPK